MSNSDCLLSNTMREGLVTPVWRCPAPYRVRLEVAPISFVMDATNLDGKQVSWDDFGGLGKYLDLLEFCADRLEQRPVELDEVAEPVAAAPVSKAEGGQSQLELQIQDNGPVSDFVEARCTVKAGAQVMAKDLFTGYLNWCHENGTPPLVQRTFGIQLSKMGFLRKRRGRGRHWWQGVELAAVKVG